MLVFISFQSSSSQFKIRKLTNSIPPIIVLAQIEVNSVAGLTFRLRAGFWFMALRFGLPLGSLRLELL
ncbi:unnamed protein product [Lathyrus oleraceus]